MSLRGAVVPVLQGGGRCDAEPLSAVLLHGEPLYVHAARSLSALPGAQVLVTAGADLAGAVRSWLERSDVPGARVATVPPGVGAALVHVLGELGERGPAGEDDVAVVLLHDPRCPLVPASCLQEVLEQAESDPQAVHAAARPVTDTVKSVGAAAGADIVRTTVDRDGLRVLASPLALPVQVLRRLAAGGALAGCVEPGDVLALARTAAVPVRWVAAPSLGRRVVDPDEVSVLECLADVRAGR